MCRNQSRVVLTDSDNSLPLLLHGWLWLLLFRQEAPALSVIAAGTKQHLKRFVLHLGGVTEVEDAPQLHQATRETVGAVVWDTDVLFILILLSADACRLSCLILTAEQQRSLFFFRC